MKVEFNIEKCSDYKIEAEKGCIYFMMCFEGQEMGKRERAGRELLIHLYPEVYGIFFKERAN